MSQPLQRRWRAAWPIALPAILGPLQHGAGDPTLRICPDGIWRTSRTPEGPVTLRLTAGGTEVLARAWGPGADRELANLPRLLGAGDDPTGFAADAHPVMAAAHWRHGAGWRVPRTTRVLEALVPAVLEQRVTGREATRAWATLVSQYGQPAPGPDPDLRVAPDGATWASVPSWAWHRAGVDPGRAATIIGAARSAAALERLSERPAVEASAALRSLAGIGTWTAAEVAVRAWGDADAVSFGDFHLARFVVHALTGRRDGTDAELAELLSPWAGHRARAIRMLELHCPAMPRRGPRATITDHRGR